MSEQREETAKIQSLCFMSFWPLLSCCSAMGNKFRRYNPNRWANQQENMWHLGEKLLAPWDGKEQAMFWKQTSDTGSCILSCCHTVLPHHITLCDITDKPCCNLPLYVSWEDNLLLDACKGASVKRQSCYFPTPRSVSEAKLNIKICSLSARLYSAPGSHHLFPRTFQKFQST